MDAHDEALDRLRAADPARDLSIDEAALRGAVDALLDDAEASEPLVDATVPVLSGPAVAAPRRPRWLQIAAVAAGVVLVGGAGFGAGRLGAGSGDAATDRLAGPITLSGGAAGAESMGAGDSATRADAAYGGWGWGRFVFAGQGLPTDAGTARVWGFDAAAVVSAEGAAHLAEVLGVAGEPQPRWGAWSVGPEDGTGPSVSLSAEGSMSYYDPTRDPWCVQPEAREGAGSSGSVGDADGDATDTTEPAIAEIYPQSGMPDCEQLAAAPAPEAAVATARDALAALGVDVDRYAIEVNADMTGGMEQSAAVFVDAELVIDGQRTGVTASVTVVADGVQSLWGNVAPLVDLGEYPVISAADAVSRLSDPRFGGYGGVMPLVWAEGASTPSEIGEDSPPTPLTPLAAGARVSWPVSQVTLTSARLGLAWTTTGDGTAALLPTWELTAADGSVWSVVALDESVLDFG